MEWLAFTWGIKPAVRLRLPPEIAERRRRDAILEGFAIAEAVDREAAILYVARRPEDAEVLRDAEAPLLAGGATGAEQRAGHLALGRGLGYPRCCVEAYADRLAAGALAHGHEDYALAKEALAASETLHARLSYFRRARHEYLIPYYPCRFDCEWSLRYATGTFEAIERRSRPGDAGRLRDALIERLVLTPDGEPHPDDGAERTGGVRLWFDVF